MPVLIHVLLFFAFTGLGAAGGVITSRYRQPARPAEHADYKERWEHAVALLGGEGRLTGEQVRRITGGEQAPTVGSGVSRKQLHAMTSSDRASIEIARARKGLPPFDDLQLMTVRDKGLVWEARAKAELRRIEGSSG